MMFLVALLLLIASPVEAIIIIGGSGSPPDPPPAECLTQSWDVQFTTNNTYSTFQSDAERGQSWKPGVSGKLYSISFNRYGLGSVSQITYRIGITTNLTSSYMVESTCSIPNQTGFIECVIPSDQRPTLTSGTTYYIAMRISPSYGSWTIQRDSSQSYANGTAYWDATVNWNLTDVSANDLPFKTKMCD